MARKELSPGVSAQASFYVEESDLASALSTEHAGTFPPVFATARMVALMELAAARVLLPLLEEGELSVGVLVNVVHTAATPPGATVTAEARFTEMEGSKYNFYIVARDEGGEIGRGTHQRVIIQASRLVEGAKRRTGV
jgi:fluoroacetyl-CoA thioesterase